MEDKKREQNLFSTHFLSSLLLRTKKMEKEREENTYSQGQRKEKDLAYLSIDKV